LRRLRKERDLTQKDIAEIFKMSESAISMYERNQREPSFEQVKEFADYFHVSVDWLMGRSESRNDIDYTQAQKNERMIKETEALLYDPDVQFIARSKQEMSPEAFRKLMELTKLAKELVVNETSKDNQNGK